MILTAAVVVPMYERGQSGSNINSFGESLWWSLVTVAAVGYGDYYPVTLGGRVVATTLMLGGLVFLSTTITLIASYYAHRRTQRDWKKINQQLDDLQARFDRTEKKIEYLIKKNSNDVS